MTGRNGLVKELANELRNLIGKQCWTFYAGESTGSDIDLAFGDKVPRTIPLLNPHLSEDERYHEGEISLFIECAWRLDSEGEVICSSTDSNVEGGPMLTGLRSIIGRAVESVKIERPVCDLTVKFNHNLVLKIFCDQTSVEHECDNYSLHTRQKIYIVGARGRVRCELRS